MAWTAPRTWTAGETVTAAIMNTHVRDNLKAIGDAWTSYVPAWTAGTTNPTIGNGTREGWFIQAGKLVIFRIKITCGSTTTAGSGVYSFGLPVTSVDDKMPVGTALVWDNSGPTASMWQAFIENGVTNAVRMRNESGGNVTDANPQALANLDEYTITGMYEAA